MKWNKVIRDVRPLCAAVMLAALLGLHLMVYSRRDCSHLGALLAHHGDASQRVLDRRSHLQSPETAAIVSAVTGEMDRPQLEPGPGIFVYKEDTGLLPFPRHDLNPRLRAKYFRMSTHWLHPEYSAYIWADGAFQIDDPVALRSFMVDALGSADCAFFKHPDRQTIVQESDAVIGWIAEGCDHWCKYLRVRYEHEPMQAQVEAYVGEGFPMDGYPLIATGLFIRRNLPHVNAAFDHWLIENFKWTIQDQLSLPYILWKHNLSSNLINNVSIWSGPFHKHTGHASPMQ